MPTFQDSLLMSELSDWINMIQAFHQPKAEKVAIRADLECDSAQSWSSPKGTVMFPAPNVTVPKLEIEAN